MCPRPEAKAEHAPLPPRGVYREHLVFRDSGVGEGGDEQVLVFGAIQAAVGDDKKNLLGQWLNSFSLCNKKII